MRTAASLLRPHSLFLVAVLSSQMASVAHASGRLGPVAFPSEQFEGFETCKAYLEKTYHEDLAKAEPAPVPIEGGSSRQTLIESKGPIAPDSSHASYDVTEGWQVRHPEPAKGYVEVSYSYRTTKLACDGGTLTGTYEQGYTLPSREDLPGADTSG